MCGVGTWLIIFTQPLRSGRIWHKVNFFKRSLTGMNSEFSFTKAEEPSLPYYLPLAGGGIIGFILVSAMWNAISPGFELVSPCPIPATITITPRAPNEFLVRKEHLSNDQWLTVSFILYVDVCYSQIYLNAEYFSFILNPNGIYV